MTYSEYWDGDNEAPRIFREAHELKLKQANFNLWLQGAYVYDAILACAPILRPLSKAKEPMPYRKRPIPLNDAEIREEKEREEREKFEQMRETMKARMAQINAQRKAKRGDSDAGA